MLFDVVKRIDIIASIWEKKRSYKLNEESLNKKNIWSRDKLSIFRNTDKMKS